MAVTSWIRRQFRDGVITTATTTMTNAATSFTVNAGGGNTFPDGSIGNFIVCVDQGQAAEEKILCSSRTADTFTVATNGRGYNGTTASAHTNAIVLATIDAQDLDEANQVAVQTLGAIQASGDLLQGLGANALQRLARGTAGQFLQAGASLLQWVGFGVSQSTTSAVGDTAADGTQTTPARSDHKHGRESFGASQSTTSAVGDSAADGTQTSLARSDHKHGREAFGVGQSTTVGSANADGTQTTLARSDHVHAGAGGATDAAWTNITAFVNSWSQNAGSFTVGYRKVNGRVYLRGQITGGTIGNIAFSLPSGYRPSASAYFPASSVAAVPNPGFCGVRVDTLGAVTPESGPSTTPVVDLSSISFDLL